MALKIITRLSNNKIFHGQVAAMKASIALSFIFHIILIFSLQSAFPFIWKNEELRTYRVELIRPPVEDLENGDIHGNHMDDTMDKEEAPPEDSQDTISLDTKDKRYVSYARLIKGRIGSQWRYPSAARDRLIEGQLMVLFSLIREGEVIEIRLLDPSGYEVLDEEAVRAVRAGAPFPPFPDHVTVKRLNIQASFDYRLTSKR